MRRVRATVGASETSVSRVRRVALRVHTVTGVIPGMINVLAGPAPVAIARDRGAVGADLW